MKKDDKQYALYIADLAMQLIDKDKALESAIEMKDFFRDELDKSRKENQKLTLELAELKSPLKKERFEVF